MMIMNDEDESLGVCDFGWMNQGSYEKMVDDELELWESKVMESVFDVRVFLSVCDDDSGFIWENGGGFG